MLPGLQGRGGGDERDASGRTEAVGMTSASEAKDSTSVEDLTRANHELQLLIEQERAAHVAQLLEVRNTRVQSAPRMRRCRAVSSPNQPPYLSPGAHAG